MNEQRITKLRTMPYEDYLIEARRSETPRFQAGDEKVFLSWGLGTGEP